jgi:hypothetical protein
MFTTGYSAKVAKEDEQDVPVFEDFAKRDWFSLNSLKCKIWGGGFIF